MQNNILFYAVNGLGLGHVTRTLSIARQLVKLDKTISPYFITSSDAAQVISEHGFLYTKLPSKTLLKLAGGSYWQLQVQYQMTILERIQALRPKAFVVDTFPLGSVDDLLGILSIKRKRMKKVFIHREQRPEKMTPQRSRLQNFYDLVIAPHHEGTARIPVPPKVSLEWAGNIMIRNREEILTKSEAQKRLNVPLDKKIVLLNFGGGGDQTTIDNYNSVFKAFANKSYIHFVVPEAPLSRFSIQLPSNASTIKYYPLVELMAGFDAAISAAGYNTFHELLYTGVPTIFVPKTRGYDDQEQRARNAMLADSAIMLYEEVLESEIVDAVNSLLKYSKISENAQNYVQNNGAEVAAQKILDII